MENEWSKYIIEDTASVLDALRKLNELSGKAMTLFAIDKDGKVKGTLTDGDVRRSLINGSALESPVHDIMHKDFIFLSGDKIQISEIQEIRRRNITLVPHINSDGTIRKIFDFSRIKSLLPVDAVLMAGGKGERLRPLTNDTPKPLLKVGDKAIIDYNVEQLIRNGITNISVTTNYLSEKIEAHFATPIADVKVKCVKEPCRLGTIGSIKLIDDFTNDYVLVMNSDLLTTINYEDFFINHIDENADMSVAVVPYIVSVPYAIFKTQSNQVMGFEEKPTYNYYANAGIYIIKREYLSLIPQGEYFDATDFLNIMIDRGMKVVQFPINGTWIDIGSPEDFRTAQELMRNHKNF